MTDTPKPPRRLAPDAPPKPRRFYEAVEVSPADGVFAVLLDGRSAKTPGGKALSAPTPALAEVIADEWRAQEKEIDFAVMPVSRLAFTVIDRGGDAHGAMADEVARYADSDLLCYLAEDPQVLAERESALWGPWLSWAEDALDVKLIPSIGITPARQAPESLERVRSHAANLNVFELTALVMATGLYGSAVLALAVQRGALDAEAAFELSRLDEAFQQEQWGVDDEARERTENQRAEAKMLGLWFGTLRD